MSLKREKSIGSKSIGFPSGRRTQSMESISNFSSKKSPAKGSSSISDQSVLTPEGGLQPENLGQPLYDCCAFVIFCSQHDKIAISRGERGKGLWLPFVPLKTTETWKNVAIGGISHILSHGDIEKITKMDKLPITAPIAMNIFRLQLPQLARFVTRVIYSVRIILNEDAKTGWKCCQQDNRISWFKTDDLLNGKVEKLWGPEPNSLGQLVIKAKDSLEIIEYSLDDALHFVPHEVPRNKEEEMIKSAGYQERDIVKLYTDFIQHCYPSSSMSYVSFVEFMTKFGWLSTDIRLTPIFRAFNYRGTGFLSFHELLLGIVAMDPGCQHGGHPGELRCGYIFRYYDINNDSKLDYYDINRMTTDIFRYKDEQADDTIIEKEANARMKALKLSDNDTLELGTFIQAVGKLIFRGTSVLFRSPTSVIQQLNLKRTGNSTQTLDETPIRPLRQYRGVCPGCRMKRYKFATHSVRLDFTGRIIDPRVLKLSEERDLLIYFSNEDTMTERLRAYSRETVFNPNSTANSVLDSSRQFESAYVKKGVKFDKEKFKEWMTADRNVLLNTLTALCRQAEEIFAQETRCVKLNSPCYVFGDVHGNLADLMTYERLLWKTGPTVAPSNYLFLGDYVDRGEFGVEVVAYLFALKILAPDKFFFTRGNHEIRSIQKVFTFHRECIEKYGVRVGPQIWEIINKVFDRMPICALIDETIYGAHGGIPTSVVKIDDIMKIPTPLHEPEGESPAAWEILWNDPMNPNEFKNLAEFMKIKSGNIHGFLSNTKRGTAFYFTEDAVDRFLEVNGLQYIIRGHEVMQLGYKFHMNGKVITVFSSSNYCGGNNEAASMFIDSEKIRVLRIETYQSN